MDNEIYKEGECSNSFLKVSDKMDLVQTEFGIYSKQYSVELLTK